MTAFVLQFLALALIASLVYHALRVEDLKVAVVAGLRRFASCVVIAFLGAIVFQLFTRWV